MPLHKAYIVMHVSTHGNVKTPKHVVLVPGLSYVCAPHDWVETVSYNA